MKKKFSKVFFHALLVSACLLLLGFVLYARDDNSSRHGISGVGQDDEDSSSEKLLESSRSKSEDSRNEKLLESSRSKSEDSSHKKLPESFGPKPTILNSCQQNIYSREELSRMCSPEVKSPKCLVTRLQHLEQGAFVPAKLRLPNGSFVQIFVNPPKDGMSGIILRHSGWERDSVNLVLRALRASTDSALVDIGCNFGVYSLSAAAMGHRVVCVEARYQIAMRLRRSAEANGLTDRMNIFWNALSANREQVKLRYPTTCDFAILKIYDPTARKSAQQQNNRLIEDPVPTDSIGLDDVTVYNSHLKGIRNLIIKVDIEGSEWDVFATAAATFENFNVSMVLMEWEWFPDMTLFITRFFTSRGFAAYGIQNGRVGGALSVDKRLEWPPDVLWIRDQSELEKLLLE